MEGVLRIKRIKEDYIINRKVCMRPGRSGIEGRVGMCASVYIHTTLNPQGCLLVPGISFPSLPLNLVYCSVVCFFTATSTFIL